MNLRRSTLLLLLLLIPVPSARAQQPGDIERAKESFKAGATAYAAGDYLAAIQALEAAYSSTPLPAIAFSLAQAERRQYFVDHDPGHLDRAIASFRRYLDEVPNGGRRGDALDALSQLEPLAATLRDRPQPRSDAAPAPRPTRLMITMDAPAARVSLDEGPALPSPLIREVEPGRHRIHVTAPGFFAEDRDLTALAGELIPLSVTLRERPSTIVVDTAEDAELYLDGVFAGTGGPHVSLHAPSGPHRLAVAEKGRRVAVQQLSLAPGETTSVPVDLAPTRQRRVAQAFFIAGGAALGIGMVSGGLALGAEDRAQDFLHRQLVRNVTAADLSSYRDDVTARDRYRAITAVSLGASAGLLVTGLLLYQLDRADPQEITRPPGGPTPEARPTASLRVGPTLTGQMAGAFVQARF